MKRCLQTLLVSFIFLIVTSLVGYVAQYISLTFWWTFGIASGILVVGALLAVILRKNRLYKYFTIFINAVSMGFYLRSWYINRGFNNPLWLMLCVAMLATAYLFVIMLVSAIPRLQKFRFWFTTGFILLSITGYLLLVFLTATTWVSTLGYFGLIQLGFALSLSAKENERLTAWQLSSYSVALCAIIIAIIALGGDGLGDLFDGLGSGVDIGGKRDKKGLGDLNGKTK